MSEASEETWEVDKDHFYSVDELEFMNYVKEFPVLYRHSISTRNHYYYKEKKTTRRSAIKNVAKRFKGTPEMVELRYKTVRTRVGRYLKDARPSGSGIDDFAVHPDYEALKWLFPYIKTRANFSSTTLTRPSCSSDRPTRPALSFITDTPVDTKPPDLVEDNVTTPSNKRAYPTQYRPWGKKSRGNHCDGSVSGIKKASSSSTFDNEQNQLVYVKEQAEEDSVSMFLKSLIPKIRELPSSEQFDLQMEIMQLVHQYVKKSERAINNSQPE